MLFVVATPIGNLSDITLRALEVLKSVDVIAAEDTRHSGILLKHFEIKKSLISYHEHNEAMRTAQLVERLAVGENIALITDYDVGLEGDPDVRPVSVAEVERFFAGNNERVRELILRLIPRLPAERACPCAAAMEGAVIGG